MDIIEQAIGIAASRWHGTENDVETLSEMALSANPGWQLATAYGYHCYADYHAYCVVLWKSKGIQGGFNLVQLRICLYEKNEDGTYSLKKIERMG